MGKNENFLEAVVIVTHGFALRVIAKFLLNMSNDEFRWVRNPMNCHVADFSVDESGNISITESLPLREST